jgi:hypothetical protein
MSEEENVSREPLKYEVYEPNFLGRDVPPHKGFTPGNTYPIYREYMESDMPMQIATMYVTKDDMGRTRHIASNYFQPKTKLIGDESPVGDQPNTRALHDLMQKEGHLNGSGIPDAIWRYKEIMREANAYLRLAGVSEGHNAVLAEIELIERQLRIMMSAMEKLKKNVSLIQDTRESLDERIDKKS